MMTFRYQLSVLLAIALVALIPTPAWGQDAKLESNGMVIMLMFNKMHSEEDEIRFSLFKFFVRPKDPRPAWDFQYVIHKVEQKKEYGFKARLVWKKFVSPEDCLKEYETWSATMGRSGNGTIAPSSKAREGP